MGWWIENTVAFSEHVALLTALSLLWNALSHLWSILVFLWWCFYCGYSASVNISSSFNSSLAKKKKITLGLLVSSAAAAKSFQSYPTLCDPIDGSPSGSSIPGILQARTLEWVSISFSNARKWKVKVKSLSRVWLDCSLPGSSVHGIFQARVLEWGAISFSIISMISLISFNYFKKSL